jgi:hypothetical protein
MEENKILNITSIADLQSYSSGAVVELPPFAPGQNFVARLRRPSMLSLMKNGKIPNSLLNKAQQLFDGDSKSLEGDGAMQEVMGVLEVMAEATFLEPTYKEIKEAGIELTDEQLMFVFNYSQQGAKVVEPFLPE